MERVGWPWRGQKRTPTFPAAGRLAFSGADRIRTCEGSFTPTSLAVRRTRPDCATTPQRPPTCGGLASRDSQASANARQRPLSCLASREWYTRLLSGGTRKVYPIKRDDGKLLIRAALAQGNARRACHPLHARTSIGHRGRRHRTWYVEWPH